MKKGTLIATSALTFFLSAVPCFGADWECSWRNDSGKWVTTPVFATTANTPSNTEVTNATVGNTTGLGMVPADTIIACEKQPDGPWQNYKWDGFTMSHNGDSYQRAPKRKGGK